MSEPRENCATHSTKGDLLFLEEMPIHPMVAMFIALPTKLASSSTVNWTRNDRNVRIFSIPAKLGNGRYTTYSIPWGNIGRRIFLYLFSAFYQQPKHVYKTGYACCEFLNNFGYNKTVFRTRDPVLHMFLRLINCGYCFEKPTYNVSAGYDSIEKERTTIMFERLNYGNSPRDEFEIRLNPDFLFKAAFPVDFRHVVGSNRRCEFWNIYLLLVDVLPRIGHRKTERITWETLAAIFGNSYKSKHAMANFKFNFKKQLAEVLEIYPQAKGKVEPTDSELRLKYAPPPI